MNPKTHTHELPMSEHTYMMIELVGSSRVSIEQAVKNAITRAEMNESKMRWFEVLLFCYPFGEATPFSPRAKSIVRIGNPTLNDKRFENFGVYRRDLVAEQSPADVMTINGTAQKTMFLLLLAMGTACFTWSKFFAGLQANPGAAVPWAFGGAIVGLIMAFVICFKHTWAPALSPV